MGNLNNKVKRIVPCEVSCKIKQLQYLKQKSELLIDGMKIYNQFGELMKNYYLYDANFRFDYSATQGRNPRYIFWDRDRYQLKYHFYTDDLLFTQKGSPIKKYGMLLEPETLQPKKYQTILSDIERFKEYDLFFTHSEKILEKLQNARPLIIGGVYIGTEYGGGVINPSQFEEKTKNVSIVSSAKRLCKLHEYRYRLAKKFVLSDKVDCFGTFNGGEHVKIWDSLGEYRYSFAIENQIESYWITERICNCFATMTVPIYLGSPKIGDFFNLDGIITISEKDLDNIDSIIERCTEQDYMNRLDAIKDNFERVKRYYCIEDWLYNEYSNELP